MEVHRCNFVEWTPAAIVCSSFNAEGTLLAVARNNSTIEVWNVKAGWIHERTIVCERRCVTSCLAWVGRGQNQRLFSAGSQGFVYEWSLVELNEISRTDSCGGPVYSVAANPSESLLSLACKDGSVRLFSLEQHEEPRYLRALLVQEGRVLSLSWSEDGAFLFAGTARGTIRKFKLSSATSELRITLPSSDSEKAKVTGLVALRDSQLASIDNQGKLHIWNANIGTLEKAFSLHTKGLRAIAADKKKSEMCFFCGGADDLTARLFVSGADTKVCLVRKNKERNVSDLRLVEADSGRNGSMRAD
jgi:U3 small nucleolar RNA-associated protein 4